MASSTELRQQIGQQMIIGLQGKTLLPEEASFIIENNIAGVIFFARNIESPAQIRELVISLQNLRPKMANQAPLLISIDMEGGRVLRLKAPFTNWPPLALVGKIESTSVAFRFAQAMGAELKAVGINFDFAPCLDILTNPKNTAIGDRSLSSNVDVVTKLGSALVRGYIKAGVITCAKHFPGHGNTLLDSHHALPIEDVTRTELEAREMEPFKKSFRAKLDFIMPTHIKFKNVDPEWPASLSSVFLKQILRDELNFRGMVVTDDLDMKALTLNYDKATIATRALEAGANLLLYCNEPDSPPIALDAVEKAVRDKKLSGDVITQNQKMMIDLKTRRLSEFMPLALSEIDSLLSNSDHARLADAIRAGSVPADLLSAES